MELESCDGNQGKSDVGTVGPGEVFGLDDLKGQVHGRLGTGFPPSSGLEVSSAILFDKVAKQPTVGLFQQGSKVFGLPQVLGQLELGSELMHLVPRGHVGLRGRSAIGYPSHVPGSFAVFKVVFAFKVVSFQFAKKGYTTAKDGS